LAPFSWSLLDLIHSAMMLMHEMTADPAAATQQSANGIHRAVFHPHTYVEEDFITLDKSQKISCV
jgi:hypothetical protein